MASLMLINYTLFIFKWKLIPFEFCLSLFSMSVCRCMWGGAFVDSEQCAHKQLRELISFSETNTEELITDVALEQEILF